MTERVSMKDVDQLRESLVRQVEGDRTAVVNAETALEVARDSLNSSVGLALRAGVASKDLAELLGVSDSTVLAWSRAVSKSKPEPQAPDGSPAP